ncbi:MAG: metallophosphatase family protein [Chloroflexota bacterium]|nr:metallophosphatase family protein [Chloroflexota bacterium]
MRIAVLSDIHGNLPALDAVLSALAPYDAIWQLGDVVGYGPQPNEVVARLAEERAVGVRGNHDAAALGDLPTDAFNDDARAAVEWTATQLDRRATAWLSALPERVELDGFTLVHGSPRDPTWEYVYSIPVARANLHRFPTRHCLVGHTHVPLVFRDDGDAIEPIMPDNGHALSLDERRAIINPGSVGQPRDGDPRASAMIVDTERRTIEWRRIEYPIDLVQQLMSAAGLPRRLIARLDYGL